MTTSPIPRFDLLRPADYGVLSIQTSRGCPFDCEFCDVVTLFGRRVRQKTPEQVLAELEVIYRLGWRKEVFITDDNFIGNRSYVRNLLGRMIPWLKSRGEPFIFWTQVSVTLDQDLELRGITVNTVSPGFTETDLLVSLPHLREVGAAMSPLGRTGRPEEVAEVVAFLAGPRAGWLTGCNIQAGGGVTIV